MPRFISVLIVLCLLSINCRAAEQPDSARVVADSFSSSSSFRQYKFNGRQLIAPGAMLAVGIAGIYTFDGFKKSVNRHLAGHRPTNADSFLEFVTPAAYLGLGFIPGLKQRFDWRSRLLAGATAYAVMVVTSSVMKAAFHEERPDGSDSRSFPSGHSAVAFTGAELMRIEYGNWVGLAGYAVATTVGILRLYNNRHWLNDILGGAAIGILSARIAYWLLPLEQRLFRLDRSPSGTTASIFPVIGATNGISFAMTF